VGMDHLLSKEKVQNKVFPVWFWEIESLKSIFEN
jgi:hypothetical protein